MVVLGLDPGLRSTGWAVLSSDGKVSLVDHGVIVAPAEGSLHQKLFSIFSSLDAILKSFLVSEAAIENVFVNSNAKSSMLLCYARCAALIAFMNNSVDIFEYAPTTIKKRVFGNGKASKDQVEYVVRASLGLSNDVCFNSHTSDAIAAGLCHIFSRSVLRGV